jgi:ISXO2-like transposase domain
MELRIREDVNCIHYRCRKYGQRPHDETVSITKNSWFENSHLSLERIMIITFNFARGITDYNFLIRDTSDENHSTSSATINDWLSFCREVTTKWREDYERGRKIGGEGIVVEIDESKIGKRKYNRGRWIEGKWILGMMEIQTGNVKRRGGELRLEICPENKRNAETLLPILHNHIEVGTIICSDLWAGYRRLTALGYEHFTVNHSVEFVNSATGANTQTIECLWSKLKRFLGSGTKEELLQSHLDEFLWRRYVKHKELSDFDFFLSCIKNLYDPNK